MWEACEGLTVKGIVQNLKFKISKHRTSKITGQRAMEWGEKHRVKRCVLKNLNYFYIGERAAFPQTFLYALAFIKTIKKEKKKVAFT